MYNDIVQQIVSDAFAYGSDYIPGIGVYYFSWCDYGIDEGRKGVVSAILKTPGIDDVIVSDDGLYDVELYFCNDKI